jgi:hypothetical protein
MRATTLDNLPDDELVCRFAAAAKERGVAVLDADARRANRAFSRMQAIDDTLRSRGLASRLNCSLLDDKNRLVRYYAAKRLYGVATDRARKVLEDNARFWFDPIAADARETLHMIDSGEYKPQ